MDAKHSILIVEGEEETLFQRILETKTDLGIRRIDFREARNELKKAPPFLLIFNLEHCREEAKLLARESSETLAETYAAVSAEELSLEETIDFMRLGVKDFLKQPLHKSDLENLLGRIEHWDTKRLQERQKKPVLAGFFSSKGGVGVTLTAVNVAVSLAKKKAGRVLLADFDLQHGNVSEFLDMTPQYTLLDLLENRGRLDARLLEHSIQKHHSGIFILPHPKQLEDSEHFSEQATAEAVDILKRSFDHTLVDLGHELNPCALACLDACDVIFVMTTPDVPSLFNAKRSLEAFKKMGYAEGKVKLVLNRWKMKGQIDGSLINKHITHPVFQKIPEDVGIALSAVNQGIPISEISEKSELAKGFDQLAESIMKLSIKTAEKAG